MNNVPESQPPLKYFLPPRPNKIQRISNKVASIAKSLLSYFRLQVNEANQNTNLQNNGIAKQKENRLQRGYHNIYQQQQQSKADKIAKKKAMKLVKYHDIETDSDDEAKPARKHREKQKQKQGSIVLKKSNILHTNKKRSAKDQVIIYGNKIKQNTNNTNNHFSNNLTSVKKLNREFKQKQNEMQRRISDQQLEYSDSEGSEIVFEFEPEEIELCKRKSRTMSKQNSNLEPKNEAQQTSQYNEEQSQQGNGNPRKKVKTQNENFLSCIDQINKKKIELFSNLHKNIFEKDRGSRKNANRKIIRFTAQDEAEKLSFKRYTDGLQKKLEEVKAKRDKRQRLMQSSVEQEPASSVTQLKKVNLNLQKILEIVKEASKPTISPTLNEQVDSIQENNKLPTINPLGNLFRNQNKQPADKNSTFLNPLSSLFDLNNNKSTHQGIIKPPSLFFNAATDKKQPEQKKDSQIKPTLPSLFSFTSNGAKDKKDGGEIAPTKEDKTSQIKLFDSNKPQVFKNGQQTKNSEIKEKEIDSKSQIQSNKAAVNSQNIKPTESLKQQSKPIQASKQQPKSLFSVQKSQSKQNESIKPAQPERLTQNPFMKKSSNKSLLPDLISNMNNASSIGSLFGKPGQSKPLFGIPLATKKSENNQFSTPTKNIFEKYPQKQQQSNQLVQPINEPTQNNDESSMCDESEQSIRRDNLGFEASPFKNQSRNQQNLAYQGFNNPAPIITGNQMSIFDTPTSFLKTIPQVDVQKSLQMFGQRPVDPTQSLWGNPTPNETNKKGGRANARSKKEQRIS